MYPVFGFVVRDEVAFWGGFTDGFGHLWCFGL
jgi:hypothetical protein